MIKCTSCTAEFQNPDLAKQHELDNPGHLIIEDRGPTRPVTWWDHITRLEKESGWKVGDFPALTLLQTMKDVVVVKVSPHRYSLARKIETFGNKEAGAVQGYRLVGESMNWERRVAAVAALQASIRSLEKLLGEKEKSDGK